MRLAELPTARNLIGRDPEPATMRLDDMPSLTKLIGREVLRGGWVEVSHRLTRGWNQSDVVCGTIVS